MYKLSLVGGDALPAQEMLVLWAHNSCMPGSVLEEQPQGSAAGELQGAGYKQNKLLWLSPTPDTWYFVFSDLHFCWLKKKYRSPGLTSICTSYLLQNDIQAWNPTWHNAGAGCWLHLAPLSAQVHFSMLLPPGLGWGTGTWVPNGHFMQGDILPSSKTG